jgi:hypothetical protein
MPEIRDPALLSQLNGGGQAAPAAPRGPVFGPPVVPKQPDPIEVENLRLRQEANARAEEEERRKRASFDGTGGEPTGEEAKNAGFLIRALSSNDFFEGTGVGSRNIFVQSFQDWSPNLANTIVNGTPEQQALAAQNAFVEAILRSDSGAAIPAEEIISGRMRFFPTPGESEEVAKQKAVLRRDAIMGVYARAGVRGNTALDMYRASRSGDPSQVAPQFREIFAALNNDDKQFGTGLQAALAGEPPAPNGGARQPANKDYFPQGVRLGGEGPDNPFDRTRYLQERFGIDPGQETRLVGMFNANNGNPNVTPAMVAGFYEAAGLGQKDPNSPEMVRMAEELRSGKLAPASGINTAAAEKAYVQGLDKLIDGSDWKPEELGDTAQIGGLQGLTFEGFDELTGVVGAVAGALGEGNAVDEYYLRRDLARRIMQRGDEANPKMAIASRIVGGIPTGVAGAAGRVNSLGSAARVGAVEGGITGFNAGEGTQNSLLGLGVGTVAGATLGTAFQAGANRVSSAMAARRTPVDPAQVQEVVDAGARREVTVRRPDVDPNVRQQRANVQQTEQGRSAIAAADAEDIGQIETALIRDLGGRQGTQRTEAASTIQTGVKAARDKLRDEADVDYTAAAAQAGNVTAPATNAIAKLDQEAAELAGQGRNLNAKELAYLEGLKTDLQQDGGLSVKGMRAQRTGLRAKLENAGVYSSDFERRIGLILDEASKDIEVALQPFPQALARYQKADDLWRRQAQFGEKVGDLLLGRDGDLAPGQAADRLMGWAKKDPARLNRLLSEADDATKEEVRALVASQIGRQANGNFSVAAFLTQTSGGKGGALSPAAIRALFGKEGQQAINDLRILSQAKVDAASARNPSNTGGLVQNAKNGLRRLILGAMGFNAAAEPMTGALVSGATIAGGELFEKLGRDRALRLLLNPDFTGWLKTLPNTANPNAINSRFASLRSTASRSPVMMGDVQAFERLLVEAVNDNGSRIAAEPQGADQTGRGQ